MYSGIIARPIYKYIRQFAKQKRFVIFNKYIRLYQLLIPNQYPAVYRFHTM